MLCIQDTRLLWTISSSVGRMPTTAMPLCMTCRCSHTACRGQHFQYASLLHRHVIEAMVLNLYAIPSQLHIYHMTTGWTLVLMLIKHNPHTLCKRVTFNYLQSQAGPVFLPSARLSREASYASISAEPSSWPNPNDADQLYDLMRAMHAIMHMQAIAGASPPPSCTGLILLYVPYIHDAAGHSRGRSQPPQAPWRPPARRFKSAALVYAQLHQSSSVADGQSFNKQADAWDLVCGEPCVKGSACLHGDGRHKERPQQRCVGQRLCGPERGLGGCLHVARTCAINKVKDWARPGRNTKALCQSHAIQPSVGS